MVNHEYWLDIYPTDEFVLPWRVVVTETRNYKVIENIKMANEDEVIEKVISYWKRYGKDKARLAQHVYAVGPNPKFVNIPFEE